MTDDTNQTPDLDVQPEDAPENVSGDDIAASVAALGADAEVGPDAEGSAGADADSGARHGGLVVHDGASTLG